MAEHKIVFDDASGWFYYGFNNMAQEYRFQEFDKTGELIREIIGRMSVFDKLVEYDLLIPWNHMHGISHNIPHMLG